MFNGQIRCQKVIFFIKRTQNEEIHMDLVLHKSQKMIGLVFCNLYAYNIILA